MERYEHIQHFRIVRVVTLNRHHRQSTHPRKEETKRVRSLALKSKEGKLLKALAKYRKTYKIVIILSAIALLLVACGCYAEIVNRIIS